MPSTLKNNLVDKLIPTVDKLRKSLLPAMGVRQYRVAVVRRRWSGEARGDGAVTIVSTLELTPPPLLVYPNNLGALHDALDATGKRETGTVTLLEVSLSYTEDELTGGVLAPNEEVVVRITDDKGQGIAPRYYQLSAPPIPDREHAIGWRVPLHRVDIAEGA